MIYLDTHVVVWLYAGETERFSGKGRELIENHDLLVSPIVFLELQYLKEIKRITVEPALLLENLTSTIGLNICDKPFLQIVTEAITQNWTRDPFDRLIVATAAAGNALLLTKDTIILSSAAAIYNTDTVDGTANRLVVVLDFGGNKTATNGTFTVTFPDPTTPANAIISMS